jgi:outer membrane protein insertion porin family
MFRGRIAVTVVALAWLAGGTFAAYAAAGVSVQGNKRVDSETIGGYFTGTDQASINKGVKDLYATGLFSDVRVSRVGDRVVITVTENNVINRVAFEGNSAVKTETLTTEVQSKSRGPYSKAMVDADIERIKDVYRRSGRAAASVTARICQTASSMSSSPSTKAERPALRQSISSATRSILPASSVNSWRRRR